MSMKSVVSTIPPAKVKAVKAGSKLSLLPKIPKSISDAVSSFLSLSAKVKDLDAQVKEQSEVIIDHAVKIQNEEGFKGAYKKSYLIGGVGDEEYVSFSRSDKFSAIDDDDTISSLKKILGTGTFNKLFEKNLELSIAPEVFKSKEKTQELAALLQSAFGDKIGEFFVKSEKWTAKEGLDATQYNLGSSDTENKEKFEALQLEVKQSKPSLKVA